MGGTTTLARSATDQELLSRVREGDPGAFGELWARHVRDARCFALHLSRSPHETDDLVAEAFAKVLRAIQRGAGPTESFKPYLITAIRRTWWRRVAECTVVPFDDRGTETPVEAEPVDDGFDGDAGRALRRLTPRWQRVLWLTEIEGRSSAEVGELLGLSPNAAAALIGRARDGLRRAYLEEVGDRLTVAA